MDYQLPTQNMSIVVDNNTNGNPTTQQQLQQLMLVNSCKEVAGVQQRFMGLTEFWCELEKIRNDLLSSGRIASNSFLYVIVMIKRAQNNEERAVRSTFDMCSGRSSQSNRKPEELKRRSDLWLCHFGFLCSCQSCAKPFRIFAKYIYIFCVTAMSSNIITSMQPPPPPPPNVNGNNNSSSNNNNNTNTNNNNLPLGYELWSTMGIPIAL